MTIITRCCAKRHAQKPPCRKSSCRWAFLCHLITELYSEFLGIQEVCQGLGKCKAGNCQKVANPETVPQQRGLLYFEANDFNMSWINFVFSENVSTVLWLLHAWLLCDFITVQQYKKKCLMCGCCERWRHSGSLYSPGRPGLAWPIPALREVMYYTEHFFLSTILNFKIIILKNK